MVQFLPANKKMLTREVSRIIPGGIGNRSLMTRGGGFALYPPARHHLRCPGSIALRCFDNIASRSLIASLRDARDASIAS